MLAVLTLAAALSAQPSYTLTFACEGPNLASFVSVSSDVDLPSDLSQAGRQDAVDVFLFLNGDRYGLRPLGRGRFRVSDPQGAFRSAGQPHESRARLEGGALSIDRSTPRLIEDGRVSVPAPLHTCTR